MKPSIRISLTGDMTVEGVAQALNKIPEANWKVEVPPGFNQWNLEVINPNSSLRTSPPDVLIVLLSPRWLNDTAKAQLEMNLFLENIQETVPHTQVFVTEVVVDPNQSLPLTSLLEKKTVADQINLKLRDFRQRHQWFHLIDLPSFVLELGLKNITDIRFEMLSRRYFSPIAEVALARWISRSLFALNRPSKKVLAIDLDQTMWGGILGEDGPEKIILGADAGGFPYLRFQSELLRLKNSGILLVITSKNDETEALKVIDQHPDMILRSRDFVAHRINWLPKAENIKSIASELSLGVDSFVFFDDSEFERNQMRQLLPEVDVIDVSKDATDYVQCLSQYTGFDSLRFTQEDLERTQMYHSEQERKKLQNQSSSIEDFYRSLEMKAELVASSEENLPRIHQLIHKTNQFNLTSRRYSDSELKKMHHDRDHYGIYALRLKDKLGESGLTGVVIIKKEKDIWCLDSFLLSCRIIGRTVEYSLIRWIFGQMKKSGVYELQAEFIPTNKNTVAQHFLTLAGFESMPEKKGFFRLSSQLESAIPVDFVMVQEV